MDLDLEEIKGWPVGAGWPVVTRRSKIPCRSQGNRAQKLDRAMPNTSDDAKLKLNQAKINLNNDLTYCNIRVGRTGESDERSQPS